MKNNSFWNIANMTSLIRVILSFISAYLLFQGLISKIIVFFMIIVIFFMDFLDGFFARKFNTESEFGGIFDITADRIVEDVFWIVFAFLHLIPLWAPFVVIVRGFTTDAIRTLALSKGMTAFGKKTMIKSKIGRFFVSSNSSRFIYASFKLASFALLTVILIIKETASRLLVIVNPIVYFIVYLTLAFCVIRSIPVIYEGRKLFD